MWVPGQEIKGGPLQSLLLARQNGLHRLPFGRPCFDFHHNDCVAFQGDNVDFTEARRVTRGDDAVEFEAQGKPAQSFGPEAGAVGSAFQVWVLIEVT